MTADEKDRVRELLARHMNALSVAESLALAMLDLLRESLPTEDAMKRRLSAARTLEMIESWHGQAARLWTTLGLDRRQPAELQFDGLDRRRRAKRTDD